MYRKFSQGWFKHADFIVLDIICLQIAFIFSYWLRNGISNPYSNSLYRETAVILVLICVCVAFLSENHKNILRRGYLKEFRATIVHTAYIAACEGVFLFLTKQSDEFSRISFLYFVALYPLIMYVVRCGWKKYLSHHGSLLEGERGILLIACARTAQELAVNVEKRCLEPMKILGLALVEEDGDVAQVGRYPVVASGEKAILEYVQNSWVDEIMMKIPYKNQYPKTLVDRFGEMGIVVHQCLDAPDSIMPNRIVEKLWGYTVVTSYIHKAKVSQLLLKRIMDICGAIVGLIITGLLTVVIGPMIYIASPGPIFFSQVRIGRGGKKFRIYKFRSMYMDAEKRKAELMERNKMNGHMFKIDADPRIIGSGPDGTKHGLGWFIRKTSIDEFPQFWNVLKGDMSLVGTRPPTVDEWEQYEYHHRARMAIKPGITGLWQVSGRSDITDFEEVVSLDMDYIRNWSLGEDVRILFRTVAAVLKGRGSA